MKNVTTILVLLFMVLMALVQAGRSEEEQLNEWQEILRNHDMEKIVEIFKGGQLKWPHIGASETSASQRLLAQELLAKIQSDQFLNLPVEKLVPLCEQLSTHIINSGGYVNVVLAETAQRILIAKAAKYVASAPEAWIKVEPLLNERCFPDNLSALADALEEADNGFQLGATSNDPKELLSEIRQYLGLDDQAYMMLMANQDSETSRIIKSIDARKLLGRMIVTEISGTTLLAAIEFLKRGGKLDALPHYSQDYSEFKGLMGDSINRSNLHFWPSRRIGPDEIADLLVPAALEHYLGIAVQ